MSDTRKPTQEDFNAARLQVGVHIAAHGLDDAIALVLDAMAAECADANDFNARDIIEKARRQFRDYA